MVPGYPLHMPKPAGQEMHNLTPHTNQIPPHLGRKDSQRQSVIVIGTASLLTPSSPSVDTTSAHIRLGASSYRPFGSQVRRIRCPSKPAPDPCCHVPTFLGPRRHKPSESDAHLPHATSCLGTAYAAIRNEICFRTDLLVVFFGGSEGISEKYHVRVRIHMRALDGGYIPIGN